MSCINVSPVLSKTKVPAASDHESLKLVVRAEIQIWRTGVFGLIMLFAPARLARMGPSIGFEDAPKSGGNVENISKLVVGGFEHFA